MTRKISKFGNSLGITLPKDELSKHKWDNGVDVDVKVYDDKIVLSRTNKVDLPQGISPDFFETLETNYHQYEDTIKELKDR
ncbi:AbrB family transcriptional regulator [Pontibacillus yanchengensis]|uniref:AbrB family transcriptional regulator n=2 Tax=Pontibacillus yanchengensis TaxID=462910 RepID=A0ACC7VM49_9BACI|nr:AbrB family transcriptional regulator [Pontibacillus yanchengensis]MYL36145.1 AbrB family transcriptional regulator [Pontibacillus yanchengensis]MYL55867.1 AbrB family transcriptional regulator [Pontibacillus yanchengensis]